MNISNKKICTLAALLFIVISVGIAQPKTIVTYETKLLVADKAANEGDYYGAIEYYEKAFEESNDQNLLVTMADLYMLARDYKRAERLYVRLLRRDRTKEFEEIRLDYGNALKKQGLYAEALEQYNLVINNAEMDDSIIEMAKFELSGIQMMDQLENNLEAIITYLPGKVNSGSAESSPAVGPDGALYFSSFNTRKEIIVDGEEGDYHAKLYTSKPNDKGEFDKITAIGEHINRKGFNSGGVSFSRDGRLMYFTRATLNGNGIATSQIYRSSLQGSSWSPPAVLANVNGNFNSKHPYEGDLFGRKVLFFSSDMDGGIGGYDIYYADLEGDSYGLPVNLGPGINTAKDEITPFYKDGSLYFSSEGHPSLGGFDIYFATWSGSSWGGLTNMGFQYNTAFDDMFLRFDPAGTTGYLVSNRPAKGKIKMKGSETCCDDIYGFYLKELVIDLLASVVDSSGPLAGATVELYDLTLGGFPDAKTNINLNEFNFGLEAERNYKAIITKEGYFPDSVGFNTVGILDDYTVKKTVTLKAKPKEKDVEILNAEEAIRLNNIYYDLDKYDILPDAEEDLSYLADLMFQYPDMVIELSSHTDSRSDAAYNQRLSQLRAESAKSWLVTEGIDAARIKPVGYGESMIINRCTNGVRCSEDEHRVNRRTEFKIIAGPKTIEIKRDKLKSRNGQSESEEVEATTPPPPPAQGNQRQTPPPSQGNQGQTGQPAKSTVNPPANTAPPATITTPAKTETPKAEPKVDPKREAEREAAKKAADEKRAKLAAEREAARLKKEEERKKAAEKRKKKD